MDRLRPPGEQHHVYGSHRTQGDISFAGRIQKLVRASSNGKDNAALNVGLALFEAADIIPECSNWQSSAQFHRRIVARVWASSRGVGDLEASAQPTGSSLIPSMSAYSPAQG